MDDIILKINNLSKTYGSKKALDNVSLELKGGRVFGILGPNGSGKTTLIKIITGLQKYKSGEVLICNQNPSYKTKALISYLPDRNFLFDSFSIKDAINLYEDFFEDFDKAKAIEMLEFMDLNESMEISSLSKGMKEKLHLTMILSRNAKIYILDEPIAGVDPVARDQILEAIVSNLNSDSTMLITTHLVRDMEQIFDEVAFISDGKIILQDNAEKLRSEKNMQIDDIYKELFSLGGHHA
ncbi:MAG: ABC transporter ATP-binding protein [Peptoniphilaceae bacterium]